MTPRSSAWWELEGRRMFSAESMAGIPELDGGPALQALSA
jgi:hypothetical protein